jgi:Domain of unknown function (DUF4389)
VDAHPVRLVVRDDLHRSRLTVFFRLLLAIPHFVWAALWTIAVVFAAIVNWIVALAQGRPADGLHRFLSAYIRYIAHLSSYLGLVANAYPPFDGRSGQYAIDVELPEPSDQSRWLTLFRLFLGLPALLVAAVLGGGFPTAGGWSTSARGGGRKAGGSGAGGVGSVVAVLGWFASVVTGRMPKGFRDAGAYSIGYDAQTLAYLLLVTDRYPNADPTELLAGVERPPEHPVRLVGDPHDLRRSRVTVFFRVLLALPHVVWLLLWSVVVLLASIVNWVVTLFSGTPSGALHRFTSRWLRYRLHVASFLSLAANPFPGFAGEPGNYPLDLELPGPGRQNRWKTAFRLVLAVPAIIVGGALVGALVVAAFLTWFVALVRGEAPEGLRNLSAYALRYDAQVNAYVFFVTDAYAHASPLEGAFAEPVDA